MADDLTAKYPAAWPARLTLTLTDGTRLRDASDYPRGNPENPIDRLELEDKFTSLVTLPFGSTVAGRGRDAIHRLRGVGDMAGVFASLIDERPTVRGR